MKRRWLSRGAIGLVVVALVGCESPIGLQGPRSTRSPDRPDWVARPPASCRVGRAGPTLDPGDALRAARAAAIEAFAESELAAGVHSISGTGAHGDFELSTQSLSGVSRDVRLVAVWAETRSRRDTPPRITRVHALACEPGPATRTLDAGLPASLSDWLAATRDPTRVCALGVAGPTRRSAEQARRALEDARASLALVIESRVEKRVVVRGAGVARVTRRVTPSAESRARVARVDALERRWRDASGTGPLGLPGVLYGLACVDA